MFKVLGIAGQINPSAGHIWRGPRTVRHCRKSLKHWFILFGILIQIVLEYFVGSNIRLSIGNKNLEKVVLNYLS